MKSKLTVILIAGISLVGCTTMRPIETGQANLTEQLETGDHLVIYEKSGRIVDMTLDVIDGDSLEGTLAGNNLIPVEVDINDIEKIEVEKIDGVKTTLAVVGGHRYLATHANCGYVRRNVLTVITNGHHGST